MLAARLGIRDRVLLPGFVDARAHLPLISVFVLPSLSEGLPLVLLEAIQEGVPVVASRTGGIPDVLGHGRYGTLVTPGSACELAEALNCVLADIAQAKQRALMVRDAISHHHSAERMAGRYVEMYEEVLNECA
jgi:glycosyltransferase involved in cell wall biosynthesis